MGREESPNPETKQYKGTSGAQNQIRKKSMASVLCRLLGCILLIGVIISVLPATLPRIGGYEIYHVESGSMEPEIPVGSAAYIKYIAPADVKVNDVIGFISGQTVIIHRVVENNSNNREITTKGDANPLNDISKVSYDNYLGVVAFHFPRLGAFISAALGVPGRFILLVLALAGAALIIFSGRIGSKKER